MRSNDFGWNNRFSLRDRAIGRKENLEWNKKREKKRMDGGTLFHTFSLHISCSLNRITQKKVWYDRGKWKTKFIKADLFTIVHYGWNGWRWTMISSIANIFHFLLMFQSHSTDSFNLLLYYVTLRIKFSHCEQWKNEFLNVARKEKKLIDLNCN